MSSKIPAERCMRGSVQMIHPFYREVIKRGTTLNILLSCNMLDSTEGWSCDKAIQSMNRKHSFQPARRRHRFYESCIKQVFAIAFSHLAWDSPLHGKTEQSFKHFVRILKPFFHTAVKQLYAKSVFVKAINRSLFILRQTANKLVI